MQIAQVSYAFDGWVMKKKSKVTIWGSICFSFVPEVTVLLFPSFPMVCNPIFIFYMCIIVSFAILLIKAKISCYCNAFFHFQFLPFEFLSYISQIFYLDKCCI